MGAFGWGCLLGFCAGLAVATFPAAWRAGAKFLEWRRKYQHRE